MKNKIIKINIYNKKLKFTKYMINLKNNSTSQSQVHTFGKSPRSLRDRGRLYPITMISFIHQYIAFDKKLA